MLPHEIDEETFTKLDGIIQVEYEKKGELFYLQTSGLVPKARHDEFRNNNITLKTENEILKSRVDIFGDITETEFSDLKAKALKGAEGFSDEEKEKLVTSEVEKRIIKLNEENKKVVNDLTDKNNSLNSDLSKLLINTNLKTIGITLKVKPEAIQDFITRGSEIFKLVDGKPTPVQKTDDGKSEILYGKDGQTPLTMDDWATELSEIAPHLFKDSSGTGDRHNFRKQNSGGADPKVLGLGKMQAARQA